MGFPASSLPAPETAASKDRLVSSSTGPVEHLALKQNREPPERVFYVFFAAYFHLCAISLEKI